MGREIESRKGIGWLLQRNHRYLSRILKNYLKFEPAQFFRKNYDRNGFIIKSTLPSVREAFPDSAADYQEDVYKAYLRVRFTDP
jgi:hypothetical protein